MKPSPGRRPRPQVLAHAALGLPVSVDEALAEASTASLRVAMHVLEAEILSRRELAAQYVNSPQAIDLVARQINPRVDRIRLVVAELRRRGEVVEWEG